MTTEEITASMTDIHNTAGMSRSRELLSFPFRSKTSLHDKEAKGSMIQINNGNNKEEKPVSLTDIFKSALLVKHLIIYIGFWLVSISISSYLIIFPF